MFVGYYEFCYAVITILRKILYIIPIDVENEYKKNYVC